MVLVKDLGMQLPSESSKRAYRYGIYMCEVCGEEYRKRTANINIEGICVHCSSKNRFTKHGGKSEKLYSIWQGIKQRCLNKKNASYKNYGLRGIQICDVWKENYASFRDWSLQNGYKEGLTIDRINNDGNYEPNNCRWTTQSVQMQNTRLIHSTNTSGYRGVHYSKFANKWRALVQNEKKSIHLGYFENAVDGAKAYNKYVIDNNLDHTLNEI